MRRVLLWATGRQSHGLEEDTSGALGSGSHGCADTLGPSEAKEKSQGEVL